MGQVGLMRRTQKTAAWQRWRAMGRVVSVAGLVGLALSLGACVGQEGPVTSADGQAEMTTVERTLWSSGVEAEAGNKYEQAISAFGNLYDRRPNDARVLLSLLRNLRYGGRAMDAVNFTQQRAANMMANDAVKFEYAKSLLAAGRKAEALSALRDVAATQPDNWQVHSATGIAFDSLGRFSDAIAAYRTALRLSPDNVVVMNNLGMSQAMAGQLQAAISTLEGAALLNRSNTHVRQNLALLYAANGEPEKARALAAMDMDSGDLETNLSFYRRFGGALP